jgi:hypothetical protein
VTDVKERAGADEAVFDEADAVDEQLVEQLAERARAGGLQLSGEVGCWPG